MASGLQTETRLGQRTVHGAAATILLRELEAIGGDVAHALGMADLASRRDQILQGTAVDILRVPFARLSREVVLALHENSCRRDSVPPLPVDQLQMMCLVMTACPTLGVALYKAMEFVEQVQPGRPRFRLREEKASVSLIIDTGERGRNRGDMIVILYGLAALQRLLGWLAAEPLPLQKLGLRFPKTYAEPALNRLLELRPDMEASENYICFPKACLSWPVMRRYKDLKTLFQLFPFDLLPPEDGEWKSLGARARSAIMSALDHREPLPDMERLADMFGLTKATFRRRLSAENMSLGQIRMECRRERAVQMLKANLLSVKEIAALLQFSDAAAFRRSFRSWEGKSPQEYRAAILK